MYQRNRELTAENNAWKIVCTVLACLLLATNFSWGQYVYFQPEPRLTELHMVEDGKEYVELYFGPEDCLDAGNNIKTGVYWNCQTQ